MIPVKKNNYSLVDLNDRKSTKNESQRIELLRNQLRIINHRKKEMLFKAKILYIRDSNSQLPLNISKRCCNFCLLEKICLDYNSLDKTKVGD